MFFILVLNELRVKVHVDTFFSSWSDYLLKKTNSDQYLDMRQTVHVSLTTECSPLGAAATVAVGHMSLEWSVWGGLVLGGFTFLIAGALFLMDLTDNIWLSYTCFCLFKTVFLGLATICT